MAKHTTGLGAVGRARASVAAIETLHRIREQARTVATDAEKVTLSGWSGWGPLAKAFAPDSQSWVDMAEQISIALPADDVRMGMKGTYMAFYTPRALAAAMWEMLREFGYDGGPVAELGCGGGVFFGTAPDGVPLVGVERDPTAAAICKLLHPGARVINTPLEDTLLPAQFAAVVGNVPFGDVQLFDPTAPSAVKDNLHNYFIWRAVQALAPGGFAVLLTSRHTMDSWSFLGRSAIGRDADFVGAVRLPNGALGGDTDALADIVVLRRKGGTKRPTYGQSWNDTSATDFDPRITVNDWWEREPGAVLGTMKAGKTNQHGLGLVVDPHGDGSDIVDRLLTYTRDELVPAAQARNLRWAPPPAPEEFDVRAAGVVTAQGWHEGSMRLTDTGGVLVVKGGKAAPIPRPGPELLRLLRLRDLAVKLVRLEADYRLPDQAMASVRVDALAAYRDYVKHHGPLNRYTQRPAGFDEETGLQQWTRRYPTMQGFRHDPDAPLVFALEMFHDDGDGDTAEPGPILLARQNLPPVKRERTDDPAQALAWCLDVKGRVDLPYIAWLLGRPVPADRGDERDEALAGIAGLLGGKVLLDPTTREWLTAEEYLSGDVRGKHRAAQTAAKHDGQFAANVAALAKVLPKWLGPDDITTNINAPWISPADVRAFLAEVVGYSATVKRAGSRWEVETQGALRNSVAASAQWGTTEFDAFTLVQLALNGKTRVV